MHEEVAKRLTKLRESLDLNQEQMAKQLLITQSYWSYIESGSKGLSKRVALKLDEKFNVNLSWLYKGEEPMIKNEPPNAPINMIPKREYDSLKADYDRLQVNYDRLQTNYDRVEKRLERYEGDDSHVKGKIRQG